MSLHKNWSQSELVKLNSIVSKALTTRSGYRLAAEEFGVSESSCRNTYYRYKNSLKKLNTKTVVSRKPISTPVVKQEVKPSNALELKIKRYDLDLNKGIIIIHV